MSKDFEQARRAIEDLRQKDAQIQADKKSERTNEELEKQTRKRINDYNESYLIQEGEGLLDAVNEELFSGNGRVSGWREVATPINEYEEGQGWGDYPPNTYYRQDRCRQAEITIPNVGEIALQIPIEAVYYDKRFRQTGFWIRRTEERYEVARRVRTPENRRRCVIYMSRADKKYSSYEMQGKGVVGFGDRSNEEFFDKVKAEIVEAAISISAPARRFGE